MEAVDEKPFERVKRKPLPACVIREMVPSDRDLIFGTYLKHGHNCYAYRNMTRPAFANYGARLLEQLIGRSQVLVAEAKDGGELLGFAITERPFKNLDHVVLHFVYVKAEYRMNRLCSKLIEVAKGREKAKTTLFATHMNPTWWLLSRVLPNIYNPFLLFPEYHTDRKDNDHGA